MLKILLPVIVVLMLAGGLIYFRFFATSSKVISPAPPEEVSQEAIEVPKTLPEAPVEDNVKALEKSVTTLVGEVNALKAAPSSQNLDTRLKGVEAAVVELKARVSSLESATPQPVSASSKSTIYTPLGSGGSWGNQDWYATPEYEISMDPANYPGYKNMNLEVIFRLVESAGTGSVRLYNVTDSTATSSQVDTTSTSFSLLTTSSFTLSSGAKTYRLQVKSSDGKTLFIQSARIRVNF